MHCRPIWPGSLRLTLISIATIAASAANAEISYRVSVRPEEKKILVEISVPAKAGAVSIQIPNWMPGAYSYGNFYEGIHDVTAVDPTGSSLTVLHPDKNTWQVSPMKPGPVRFGYWVSTAGGRRFGQSSEADYIQISGPSTYAYVVGRKQERCRITFDLPAGWPIATGLDTTGERSYKAPTYDVLADNPVSAGNIILDHYSLRGKEHTVVLEGAAKTQVDQAKLLKDCRFVSAAETDFFGGAPYHQYVWHFTVFPGADGAGGLEHLSSTQISLASGEGPRAQSVLAHEYFHLWNVKRIRSFPLGPFDYLHLPKTGALWWLEGTTDYYASLLPFRYGEWQRPAFYEHIVSNVDAIRTNPAYGEVGANDASLRVAEAENGRGNSNGFRISYYNLGWVAGMCLDTEIRYRTGGHRSLDDVVRALFALCKDNKPGFEEDEIRKQCIRVGGPTLGPFYDQTVLKAGQMPIEDQLKKMGLRMVELDEPYADLGFGASASFSSPGLMVNKVSVANAGKLESGDQILSLDGVELKPEDRMGMVRAMPQLMARAQVGQAVRLKVKRQTETMEVVITPTAATRKVHHVEEDPSATAGAIQLRDGWLKNKKPSVM